MTEQNDHPEPAPEQGPAPETHETPQLPAPKPGAQTPCPPPTDASGRNWAALAHLAAFLGYASVPVGFVLGPLIVWAIMKDKHPLVDDQGKEAINFQLSVLVYTLAAIPLICVCVGIALLVLLSVLNFVFIIVATVRASGGEHYRYPLTIRFLR